MSDKAKKTEVKVVEQALVASFMGALSPSVWRVELGRLNAASFELGSEGGKTSLYLKEQGDKREAIAIFSDIAAAEQALNAISKAVFQGGGSSSCPIGSSKMGRRLKWGAAIVLIIILFLMFSPIAKPPENQGDNKQQTSVQAPVPRTGVPLPADEVFGN